MHIKKIIPGSSTTYQKILTRYRYNSFTVRLVSYTISFKFSLLLLSYFYLKREYRGDYGPTQIWYFNLISLIFIAVCVPLICTSTIYYLIDDTIFSYAGFAALETLVLSLLLASLMVVDAISVFKCAKGEAPKRLKVYAAPAADLDYESQDEGQRIKKRMGKGFANEFGDYEDRKNSTNNSLLYDEMRDALKQITLDKEELEKQTRELKELIRHLIEKGLNREEVMKIIDEKLGEFDTLNRANLQQMYEEQLFLFHQQNRQNYKDFETEMENNVDVQSVCQIPDAAFEEVCLLHDGEKIIKFDQDQKGYFELYEQTDRQFNESAIWHMTAS